MARIGGRNVWLAVPAGLICAAVVGVLGWLALPMVPVSVAWVGQMYHSATNLPRPEPAPPNVASIAAEPGEIDCRTLYPDGLWAEMTWSREVLLSQTLSAPPTAVAGLTDALAPTVRVSCEWHTDGGKTIVSTLSNVAPDAAPIAEAAFRGAGFDCTTDGEALTCSSVSGDVREDHVLRGDLWLSSVESSWPIDDYASRLALRVWG